MRDFRRYASTVAAFATVLYAALLVAGFGLVSLWLDRDVIHDAAAGPLAGPVMTAASTVLMLLCLLAIANRVPEDLQRVALGQALLIALGAYLAFVVVGGFVLSFGGSGLEQTVRFVGGQLVSPFALIVGLLAFVVVVLYMVILASRVGDRGRPQWPWEKRGD